MPLIQWRTKEGIFQDIAAAFLTLTGKDVNDLNAGSVLRTLLDVWAEEHEETDFNIASAMYRSSLRYAQGADLDAIAADEGLTRNTATSASGYVRLSRATAAPSDSPVAQAGSIIITNGSVDYSNTVACRIFTGATSWVVDDGLWESIDIPFSATTTGAGTNTGGGTITTIKSAPSGVDSATNPALFSGGRIAETDTDFRARIGYERDRKRGGSRVALLAEALRESDVFSAAVYEWTVLPSGSKFVKPTPGEVWAYVFGTFSATDQFSIGRQAGAPAVLPVLTPATLKERVRNALEFVRPFPITCRVFDAYAVLVWPHITITHSKSYRLTDTSNARMEVMQRLRNYVLQLKIGESLSTGQVLALLADVLPFKTAEVVFDVYRNRTHEWVEADVEDIVVAEMDEIIKPYGVYTKFGTVTIQVED